MSEMKVKVHSILTVVHAKAIVERPLREDWEDLDCAQMQIGTNCQPEISSPDHVTRFFGKTRNGKQNAYESVSWGVLFSSEYFLAPDIGPILIVCPCGFMNADGTSSLASNKSTFSNCCLLQFEDQLSTRSSLRIFHGY